MDKTKEVIKKDEERDDEKDDEKDVDQKPTGLLTLLDLKPPRPVKPVVKKSKDVWIIGNAKEEAPETGMKRKRTPVKFLEDVNIPKIVDEVRNSETDDTEDDVVRYEGKVTRWKRQRLSASESPEDMAKSIIDDLVSGVVKQKASSQRKPMRGSQSFSRNGYVKKKRKRGLKKVDWTDSKFSELAIDVVNGIVSPIVDVLVEKNLGLGQLEEGFVELSDFYGQIS